MANQNRQAVSTEKADRPNNTTQPRNERPERIPMGGFRDIISVQYRDPSEAAQYKDRWVTDTDTRLMQFQAAWWDFVPAKDAIVGEEAIYNHQDHGSVVSRKRGSTTQYLMRIKKELYEEDRTRHYSKCNTTEEQIKTNVNANSADREADVYNALEGSDSGVKIGR